MKKRMALLFAMALLLGTVQTLNATCIDFEDSDCETPRIITDEYRDLGLVFSGVGSVSGQVFSIPLYGAGDFGNSLPCVMHIGERNEPTTTTFVLPGTSTPTTARDISVLMGDGNVDSETFTVTCFDINGDPLDSQTHTTTVDGQLVEFDECASIEFYLEPESGSGAVLDDFCFNEDPDVGWAANAEASVYGSPEGKRSVVVNNLAFLLIPLGTVIFLRIMRRKK